MELVVPTEVILTSFTNPSIQIYFETDSSNMYFEYQIDTLEVLSNTPILKIEFNSSEYIPISLIEALRGPAGLSEEDTMYSKRVDFINDNLLYRGEAQVGSIESSNAWRIRQITIGVDGDVSEIWASGSALFDKQWSQRLTYIYS